MSSPSLLVLGLAAILEPERTELVRRGYELLPDSRWLEELEKDREASILDLPEPAWSTATIESSMVVDVQNFGYDPPSLYPPELPPARDPNERFLNDERSESAKRFWSVVGSELLGFAPRYSLETWFRLPKSLHSRN